MFLSSWRIGALYAEKSFSLFLLSIREMCNRQHEMSRSTSCFKGLVLSFPLYAIIQSQDEKCRRLP